MHTLPIVRAQAVVLGASGATNSICTDTVSPTCTPSPTKSMPPHPKPLPKQQVKAAPAGHASDPSLVSNNSMTHEEPPGTPETLPRLSWPPHSSAAPASSTSPTPRKVCRCMAMDIDNFARGAASSCAGESEAESTKASSASIQSMKGKSLTANSASKISPKSGQVGLIKTHIALQRPSCSGIKALTPACTVMPGPNAGTSILHGRCSNPGVL
mmetsp:Transcript_23031/g.64702  ORF Transcript_23031/g.64702 Transcript_23031/m.64702 type:complete len:213 (+) Transcript_23031:157-795(+)